MGYQTENLDSGALLVRDVPLMGPQKLTEKHFEVKDIDEAWMDKAVENFAKQKKIGKLPLLWDRHNTREVAANVIGRLDNMRVEHLNGEAWLYADVIITAESHKAKFLEGGSPSKSVEFQPDNYYMRGLSLLDGHEGHFDYGIPDFVPEGLYDELVALSLDPKVTVLCHSKSNNATGAPMDFSLEDVKAAIVAVVEPINQRLQAIEQKVGMASEKPPEGQQPEGGETKPAPNEGNQNMSKDVDTALDDIRREERARYDAGLAAVKRQAKIDNYTLTLTTKTGMSDAIVRKKLNSFQSDEALDLYVKGEMKRADDDVKLDMEREHRGDPDLAEEHENFCKRYNSKIDFDQYVRLSENLTKPKDYRGKQVYAVRDNGGAFA